MLNALNDIVFEETVKYNKDSVIKYIDYIKEIATPEETRYLLSLYKMRIFDSQSFSDQKEEAIRKELSFLDSKTNKPNDIYKEIASTYCVGVSFYTNEQFEKALPLVEKALKMTETLSNEIKLKYMKRITWKLCFIYANTDKHPEAVKMMEKLIDAVEMEYKTDYQRQRPFYKKDGTDIRVYTGKFKKGWSREINEPKIVFFVCIIEVTIFALLLQKRMTLWHEIALTKG